MSERDDRYRHQLELGGHVFQCPDCGARCISRPALENHFAQTTCEDDDE